MHMPCSSTPTGPVASGLHDAPDAAFRRIKGVGSRDDNCFGAQSHGLCTGCLRFAVRDHSLPTQDSLPAVGQLCRVGLDAHRALTQGLVVTSSNTSLPRLHLAH
jgi:hypothetical protein